MTTPTPPPENQNQKIDDDDQPKTNRSTLEGASSLSDYVTIFYRKFNKLYHLSNEFATILNEAEQLQILQYCLSCFKEKTQSITDVKVNSSLVLRLNKLLSQTACARIKTIINKAWENIEQKTMHVTNDVEMEIANKNDCESSTDCSIKDTPSELKISDDLLQFNLTMEDWKDIQELFEDFKMSSNHLTMADVFEGFVREICREGSAVYKEVANCGDLDNLICDLDEHDAVQKEVYNLMKRIIEPKHKSRPSECSTTSELMATDTADSGQHREDLTAADYKAYSVLLSPKTPVCSKTKGRDMMTPSTPFTHTERQELQKVFVEDIFRSYLHLLVNSRSQVALARVFNIPERGLDHWAFTHLKHEATREGLSMYQAMSSFVLRLQLGGKGYAPGQENPLMDHLKGLSCLLDLMHKLQMVVEEDPCVGSACKRVVNILKNNLTKCKSGRFPRAVVESIANDIHTQLAGVVEYMKQASEYSPEKAVGSGGSVSGRRCMTALRSYLDQSAVMGGPGYLQVHFLRDVRFSDETPTRFPSLLTQFRSPGMLAFDEEEKNFVPDDVRPDVKGNKGKSCSNFVSCALYVDSDAGTDMLCSPTTLQSIEVLPSKTIVHPRPGLEESEADQPATKKPTLSETSLAQVEGNKKSRKAGNLKRKKTAEPSLEKENAVNEEEGKKQQKKVGGGKKVKPSETDSPKTSKSVAGQRAKKDKPEGGSKSCRRRLLPQVKGQAKITAFMRL